MTPAQADRLAKLETAVRQMQRVRTQPRLILGSGGGATIEFTIDSVTTAGTSSPYNGLKVATVTVETAPCDRSSMIGESIEVVDHSGCLFNEENEALVDRYGWAHEQVALSLASGAEDGELTPCHWSALNICCP